MLISNYGCSYSALKVLHILIYRKGDSKEYKKKTKYIINKNDFAGSNKRPGSTTLKKCTFLILFL